MEHRTEGSPRLSTCRVTTLSSPASGGRGLEGGAICSPRLLPMDASGLASLRMSSLGSELHLPGEEPEDAADAHGDPERHLPAGPQPAGWQLERLICVQVPG